MFLVLAYLWQLPQNVLGTILLAALSIAKKCEPMDMDGIQFYSVTIRGFGGISLGTRFIFVEDRLQTRSTIRHEYGHTRQSLLLGWFYFFVIGFPSFVWANMYNPYRSKHRYYWFYTESWANKLGGVDN